MRYRVVFLVESEIELSDELVKEALTPEWASQFYRFDNPCEVAQHVAYNFLRNNAKLSQLDGFAQMKDKVDASLIDEDWTLDEVSEIK